MSLRSWVYAAILVIGVITLAMGLAAPSTKTVQSETCTQGGYYGDYHIDGTCVNGSYEVPNTSKGPTIIWGFLLTMVGGILVWTHRSLSRMRGHQGLVYGSFHDDLVAWKQEHQEEDEDTSSVPPEQ